MKWKNNRSTYNLYIILMKKEDSFKQVILSPEGFLEQGQLAFLSKANWNGEVHICRGMWKLKKVDKIISQIHQWKVRELTLHKNNQPKIAVCLLNVCFPNLIYLGLKENSITSVECLHCLSIPSLQTLDLTYNFIFCIKAIRKISFPRLTALFVHENVIGEFEWLAECPFTKLNRLKLRGKYKMSGYLGWVGKAEVPKLQTLRDMFDDDGSMQQSVSQKIKQKVDLIKE